MSAAVYERIGGGGDWTWLKRGSDDEERVTITDETADRVQL